MTIERLRECRRKREKISLLDERILRLRSTMESTTQCLSLAPGGGGVKDRLAVQMSELLALLEERSNRVIELEQELGDIDSWLDSLPEQQAKVMRLRYVEGMKWETVAEKTHYSEKHVFKIRDAALDNMDTK